jgi:hypothetical protein
VERDIDREIQKTETEKEKKAQSFFPLLNDIVYLMVHIKICKEQKLLRRLCIVCRQCYQGCQMIYFQTKNPNLGNFRESCNGRCRYILWPFGQFSCQFMTIWYILWSIGIFPLFGMLYQKNLATLCATYFRMAKTILGSYLSRTKTYDKLLQMETSSIVRLKYKSVTYVVQLTKLRKKAVFVTHSYDVLPSLIN